jgi:uncharacterized protein
MTRNLRVSQREIELLCDRWQITEFGLFGSVLREDFRPESDIDVLITFAVHHPWNLFDVMNLQ